MNTHGSSTNALETVEKAASKDSASTLLEEAERQRKQEHIEDLRQRRALRQDYSGRLFLLLVVQVAFVGVLILCQGWRLWGFRLHEWAFGIFINGSLIQTFFIVRQIVVHLFPVDKNPR